MPDSSPYLTVLRDAKFRFGSVWVEPYDRRNVLRFGTNYLHHLYTECLESRPTHPYGILPDLFCGMPDLSADAICSYLHTRSPLLLMCMGNQDDSERFDVVGFSFPTLFIGSPINAPEPAGERAMVLGYGYFRRVWGTPEASVLGMLSTAYYFQCFNLSTILGQSYPWNELTRRFVAQYGTRTDSVIPKLLATQNGRLVDCFMSSLTREDFNRYLADTFSALKL